jgi:hypothetical protein
MTDRKKDSQSPNRASTSMSIAEIEALEDVLSGLRAGRDMRIVARVRSAALGKVAVRLAAMRASMQTRKALRTTTQGDPNGPD